MVNTLPEICKNFVDGKWIAPSNNSPTPIINPGNLNETVGKIIYADDELSKLAMDSASNAFTAWKNLGKEKRIELLQKVLNEIRREIETFSEIITSENGKIISESRAEVKSSLLEGEFQLQFIGKEINKISEEEIRHEPLGVVLLITPSNFPLATIIRKIIPALAIGNVVVLKPSEITPLTAVKLFQILEETGLPSGVANLIIGEGKAIGPPLINHPALTAISFTGSTVTGKQIRNMIADRKVKLQAEMGGKNAVVVLNDADMNSALDAVIKSGFTCCGQWCTGTSRVILEKNIYDDFLTHLVERINTIRVGIGTDEASTMGPLVSIEQLKKVQFAVEQGLSEGARLITGGKSLPNTSSFIGYYFEPTVFSNVKPNMKIAREEIFGPVISVLKAEDIDDAILITDNTNYGLSVSVYTNNMEAAEKFVSNVNAGLCHVNLPTSHRKVSMPLLGWKDSGCGMPESGSYAMEFFTRTKSIYRKYYEN